MQERAPRNRTLTCTEDEINVFSESLIHLSEHAVPDEIEGRIINQDFFSAANFLPKHFVDLLILDPPYNLSKDYNGHLFRAKDAEKYQKWFNEVIGLLKPTLRENATIYVCSDWRTSTIIFPVLNGHFSVRNRITWEREKGRGAKSNWKNNTEDIWFCTVSDKFFFNVEAVKLKRRVMAPYRTSAGKPKDWKEETNGNYRLTHPSNIWTDLTIPFWSMPENTDHPTQKPEKLIAKLILASSRANDFVFDPFLGSGTTVVAAKKLGRKFTGIELNEEYCCWALKRLSQAEDDPSIQGYADGVFWERNSLSDQPKNKPKPEILGLFDENFSQATLEVNQE